jgi:AraC family transcriptional regulator
MSVELRLQNCKIVVFELGPKSGDELHSHEHVYQISMPLTGTGQFRYDNSIHNVGPGSTLLLTPSSYHRHEALTAPMRVLLIEMNRRFIEDALRQHVGTSVPAIEFSPWRRGMAPHFIQMAHLAMSKEICDPMNPLELQEFEAKLATLFLSSHVGTHSVYWTAPPPPIDHRPLRLCVEYIHANLASSLSLDNLSQVSGLSKYHLIRLLQTVLGVTPSSYIRDLRLTRSNHLLATTSQSITWIAFECGFNSLSSFERAFRRRFGMTPGQYRATNK